jgi:hypothetical protein
MDRVGSRAQRATDRVLLISRRGGEVMFEVYSGLSAGILSEQYLITRRNDRWQICGSRRNPRFIGVEYREDVFWPGTMLAVTDNLPPLKCVTEANSW